MKKFVVILTGLMLLIATGSALAIPITGSLEFSGAVSLLDADGNITTNPLLATGINFYDPAEVVSATGIYSSIPGFPDGQEVTFTDFIFASGLDPNPVNPLWTFIYEGITYSFILSTITYDASSSYLYLFGTGLLTADGYDDTFGTWSLTTQSGRAILSFSASSSTVPEPGTLLLFGSGLLGFGFYRRNRKKA